MTHWEYKIAYLAGDDIPALLNALGAQGWECFAVDHRTSCYWLKRPLQKTPPPPERKESKK